MIQQRIFEYFVKAVHARIRQTREMICDAIRPSSESRWTNSSFK